MPTGLEKRKRPILGVGLYDDFHLDAARLGGTKGAEVKHPATKQDVEQMEKLDMVRAGKRAKR